MKNRVLRNRFGFGIGTLGRDFAYTMISLFLMVFLTEVLEVSAAVLGAVTVVLVVFRVFDAVNDPFIGVLVDNTRSRYGKFKPWILVGVILSALFMLLMFADFGLSDVAFVVVFALAYLVWEVAYTANDLGYWSMLPALSQDQKERERIGAFARTCATIGAFSMAIAIVPLGNALTEALGSKTQAYFAIAAIAVTLMVLFQLIMLGMVKEDQRIIVTETPTRFRDLVSIIFKNDQLLAVTISLALFSTAYSITVGFGLHYFIYIYGDEDMYMVFAAVLGLAQIGAFTVYPLLSRRFNRRTLYTAAIALVVLGYALFFFAPTDTMLWLVLGGLSLFTGQAMIQLLMLMFITDTVEYGQLKLGRRNESVILSLQTFINKLGPALSTGVIGFTLIASGVQQAADASEMTPEGVFVFKAAMLLLPLVLILISYVVYRRFYRIDEETFATILEQIKQRDAVDG